MAVLEPLYGGATRVQTPYTGPSNPAPTATAAPTATGPTVAQQSARSIVDGFLADYGLSGLGAWAWDRLLGGASVEQIKLEMHDRPEYIARFPALAELRKQGRGVTEAEYIGVENAMKDVMHAFGLPAGFYDSPDDFSRLIGGNVSPTELKDRVQAYSSVVLGDQVRLSELQRLYQDEGIPRSAESDLLAYYLDPSKGATVINEQIEAATFAAASARSGFGSLSKAQAEEFGSRRDVSAQEAERGFGALYQSRELFGALPGQGETDISQNTQLGAAFGGSAVDQETIEKRRRERVAAGSGGGGFTAGQRGVSGLGSQQV